MSDIFAFVLVFLLILLISSLLAPLAIWSLNVLFGLTIPYTMKTCVAMGILLMAYSSASAKTKS